MYVCIYIYIYRERERDRYTIVVIITQLIVIFAILFVWGFDFDFTNYAFPQNLMFNKQLHLNTTQFDVYFNVEIIKIKYTRTNKHTKSYVASSLVVYFNAAAVLARSPLKFKGFAGIIVGEIIASSAGCSGTCIS